MSIKQTLIKSCEINFQGRARRLQIMRSKASVRWGLARRLITFIRLIPSINSRGGLEAQTRRKPHSDNRMNDYAQLGDLVQNFQYVYFSILSFSPVVF